MDYVARQLAIRPEHAERALRQLTDHLVSQTRRHQRVYVEGLGTFTFEDDILNFEPLGDLVAVANGEYEDLDPVTVKVSSPIARLAPRQRAAARRRLRRAIGAFVTFIAVAAATIVYLYSRDDSPLSALWPQSSVMEQTLPQEEPQPPPSAALQPAVLEPDLSGAAGSGLIDRLRGGYTVVIASFKDRAVAESEARRYREIVGDDAVPVDILRALQAETEWFRVSIGQVPTVDEALALKQRLPGLPESAWVIRIAQEG